MRVISQEVRWSEWSDRDILFIDVTPIERGVRVALEVPLDSAYAAENKLVAIVGRRLRAEYTTFVDFWAEGIELRGLLHKLFKDPSSRAALLIEGGLDVRQIRRLFSPIATQGKGIFHRLFKTCEATNFPIELRPLVREAIISALRRRQLISIRSPTPMFPWAFLYDDDVYQTTNAGTMEPASFWGYRHELQQQTTVLTQGQWLPSVPKSVLAICPEVGAAHAEQHPLLSTVVVNISTVAELGSALQKFDADVLYFFGHGHHEEPAVQSSSWIKLNGARLTVTALEVDFGGVSFARMPVLVFLNSCNAAPLGVWNDATIAGYLAHKGAVQTCCIAPIAEVPSWFAAKFATSFFASLLERNEVGTAILEARVSMLTEARSPLGLLYELFGRAQTRLSQPGGD